MRGITPFLVTLVLALGASACGGDSGCPGIVCTNCALSGDCNLQCPTGQVQYCGNFGYFDDPTQRCAYCGNP